MDKLLEALKGFLKDGTDLEAVKTAISDPAKALNPLEGAGSGNIGKIIGENPALKAAFDTKMAEATKKWEEANFDRLYRERYTKEHPEADPGKKEVLELRQKYEKLERDGRRKDLLIAARTKARELKLPEELDGILDRFIGDDEESTFVNLERLSFIPKSIQKSVEDQLKGKFKTDPPKGGAGEVTTNPWKKETLNLTKQGEIIRQDAALAGKLAADAGVKLDV